MQGGQRRQAEREAGRQAESEVGRERTDRQKREEMEAGSRGKPSSLSLSEASSLASSPARQRHLRLRRLMREANANVCLAKVGHGDAATPAQRVSTGQAQLFKVEKLQRAAKTDASFSSVCAPPPPPTHLPTSAATATAAASAAH